MGFFEDEEEQQTDNGASAVNLANFLTAFVKSSADKEARAERAAEQAKLDEVVHGGLKNSLTVKRIKLKSTPGM